MTQLTTSKERVDDLRNILEKYVGQFEKLLPQHVPPQRFVRIALNEAIKTPKLLDCSKQSFVGGLLEFAALGLEPGVAGNGWLIPYGKKATVIIGYRGLVQLALRTGNMSALWAQVVRAKDDFEYTDYPQFMRHKRFRGAELYLDDNPLVAAYSVARNTLGHEHFLVMERAEILKIKNASAAASAKESPWNLWEDEMWKKTVLKRHCKTLPLSVEANMLIRAIELDDKADAGLPQDLEVNVEGGIASHKFIVEGTEESQTGHAQESE